MTLRLDWCSHEAAKFAVEKWHYSRSLPTPPIVKVGVWEDARYIGAVLFSRGASDSIGKPYGLVQTEVAELTRVALTTHTAQTSRIVSIAMRMLRKAAPGLRLLVSYADPAQDHHGGIYQAMGWLYAGRTAADFAIIDAHGKRWHSRMVSSSGVKTVYGQRRRVIRPDEGEKIVIPGKHKYLYPLDAAMRKQIEPLRKPYPKKTCAGSTVASAPAIQAGEGGAEPTSALHIDIKRVDDATT